VVWLAHTEELCEQAIACFQDVWRYKEKVAPVTLARCWGSFTKGTEDVEELGSALSGAAVLVSTPNRIASLIERDSPLVEAIGPSSSNDAASRRRS
jgi:hypothetical protein